MLHCFSCVQLYVTLWIAAFQAPLSMGFSRPEYWSGLPGPPPGDLPDPGIKPMSLKSPSLAGSFSATSTTWKARSSEQKKKKKGVNIKVQIIQIKIIMKHN